MVILSRDKFKISSGKRSCLRLSDSRRYLNNGPVSASNASLLIILMTIVRKAKIRKDKLITEYDLSLIYKWRPLNRKFK